MTAIQSDAAEATNDSGITQDEAAEQFLARFADAGTDDASKKKPSDEGDEETANDDTTESSEGSDESPETDEGTDGDETDKAKKYVEDVEHYVKIKENGEELEVPVKDLARLYGQEAALTRKSQEVADHRKAVDAQAAQYAAGLDVLVKRASTKADEFRKINFLALTKDPSVSAEDLSVLQTEAQRVFDEERFLKGELGNFMSEVTKKQAAERQAQAVETVKTLGTPGTAEKPNPLHIEGWSEKTYDDIRTFAVTEGLDQGVVANLVDAPAIKLLHMAMLYKRGATKVATTTKTDKSPKKIVKSNTAPVARRSDKAVSADKAMKIHKDKGNLESTQNAFLAKWQAAGEDD